MKYVLAISYFTLFCVVLRTVRPLTATMLVYGAAMLFLLGTASALNDSTGLIDEKVASFVSYDMFKGGQFQTTFFIQYLLAWIPFEILDYEYTAHGLNIGLQAFIFMLGAVLIFDLKPGWKLLAFSLFPSYFHYAIFGLRDPLINLLAVTIAAGALKLKPRQFILLCAGASVVSLGIRPEFSLIIAGFGVLGLFFSAKPKQQVVIALLSLATLYGALLVMPLAFGLPSTGSVDGNIELMTRFNELRNERRLGEYGSGSHMLGGALYSYPFPVRYPIQVAGSFLAPLPMDIRRGFDILAFAESLMFCLIVVLAARKHRVNEPATLLFWCGIAYMLLQAIFAINYGNVLRVRYPCLIFFLTSLVAADQVQSRRGTMPAKRRSRPRTGERWSRDGVLGDPSGRTRRAGSRART